MAKEAMEAGHTPTPWKARDYATKEGDIWIDCDVFANRGKGNGVAGTVATVHANGTGKNFTVEANAALIVTAVNSHETLVKALQFYASEWQPNGEGDPETPGLSRSWVEPTDELQNDGGRKARAALASATPHTLIARKAV